MRGNKYDVTITDKDGGEVGYIYASGGDYQQTVASVPVDVPTVNTTSPTQSGGPYDVSSASDYKRLALSSFHSGAGQESYDTEDASPSKFYASLNIDISAKGALRLGPDVLSYTTSASTIQGITAAGLGYVWQSFDPAGSDPRNQLRYSADNVTWTAVTFSGTDPDGDVLALACDGEYMYGSFAGSSSEDGIWRGTTSGDWTQFADAVTDGAANVVALCHCGGVLYGTKGDSSTASSLAYIDGTTTWANATLSSASVTQKVDTVALVAIGPYVYWVTYGGGVTKVYAAQKGATTDDNVFQQVAEFPRGFIGLCAHAYLGSLYVGGYYESTSGKGIGVVYILSGQDMSLLTTIGEDASQDWRVLRMAAYKKHLYFIANGSLWRWSLEHGGYSHVCAVSGGTPGAAQSITWDVTEDMSAEPSTGWSTSTSGGTITVSSASGVTTWSQSESAPVVDSDAADGAIVSSSTSYSSARNGESLSASTTGYLGAGQVFTGTTYSCLESFISFDTSSIPSGATIISASLQLSVSADLTDTDFIVYVKSRDWGATLDTSDWVSGGSLSSLSTVGSFSTAGIGSSVTCDVSTSAINKGGATRFMLCSSRMEAGTAPTGQEALYVYSGDESSSLRPKLTVTYIVPGQKVYTLSSHTPSAATGFTSEIQFPTTDIVSVSRDGTQPIHHQFVYDGTYENAYSVNADKSGSATTIRFGIKSNTGAWQHSSSYQEADLLGSTVRFTARNGLQTLYLNGTRILGPIQAQTSASTAKFTFIQGYVSTNMPDGTWSASLDSLRYTNDGVYEAGVATSVSSCGLACNNESVWVGARDTGIYKTQGQATSGYLVTSRSASHMQTIQKFYRAIEVTTDQPLSGDQTLKAEWFIDGVAGGGTTLTPSVSSGTKHTWNINTTGHDIRVKLTLGRDSSVGPVVTSVAVKYLLPNMKKYTWFFNCTESVAMRNGQKWDVNPQVAIDHLFANADEYVVVDAPFDSSITGRLSEVAFVDLQRSDRPNTDYQGIVRVELTELS